MCRNEVSENLTRNLFAFDICGARKVLISWLLFIYSALAEFFIDFYSFREF